ncbi:MAG: hypothetical protein ACP5QO_01200 [Clostridia bacterium]
MKKAAAVLSLAPVCALLAACGTTTAPSGTSAPPIVLTALSWPVGGETLTYAMTSKTHLTLASASSGTTLANETVQVNGDLVDKIVPSGNGQASVTSTFENMEVGQGGGPLQPLSTLNGLGTHFDLDKAGHITNVSYTGLETLPPSEAQVLSSLAKQIQTASQNIVLTGAPTQVTVGQTWNFSHAMTLLGTRFTTQGTATFEGTQNGVLVVHESAVMKAAGSSTATVRGSGSLTETVGLSADGHLLDYQTTIEKYSVTLTEPTTGQAITLTSSEQISISRIRS